MLHFSILGPIEVSSDSVEVDVTAPKHRALLALLLLNANHVVPQDLLIDRLWGEQPPPNATTALHNGISQLRKLLGQDAIARRAPGYLLKTGPGQLDLAEFERLCERARSEAPPERAATLREALALWRGEPLADLAFEECVQGEIRHLQERRLNTLEERIGAELELGNYAEVLPELESLVALHGHRQKLVGHLMLALHQAGRDIEANATFRECSRLLDEVGLLPGQELQELHRGILRHDPSLQPPSTADGGRPQPQQHDRYSRVMRALLAGKLVPVLGPQASPAGRAPPDPAAAAKRLAEVFAYPHERAVSLTRVSQYIAITHGIGPLYDELHELYSGDYPPSSVHRSLAALAPALRARDLPLQTVITTSYDTTLERAFADVGEQVDVVSYVALGQDRGKFLHLAPDGKARVIDEPNIEVGLTNDDRTLVLKIHGGTAAAAGSDADSYVVSEDDYIDYLAHMQLSALLPVGLAARLSHSHFLFLGYDLDDWSLRVFLRRLWGNERVGYRSWAVGRTADPLSAAYWSQCGVEAFDVPLDDYVEGLQRELEAEPHGEAVA
jgi:DNA-binding SARP family transcriptional activator